VKGLVSMAKRLAAPAWTTETAHRVLHSLSQTLDRWRAAIRTHPGIHSRLRSIEWKSSVHLRIRSSEQSFIWQDAACPPLVLAAWPWPP
jgi:hypothetical protein